MAKPKGKGKKGNRRKPATSILKLVGAGASMGIFLRGYQRSSLSPGRKIPLLALGYDSATNTWDPTNPISVYSPIVAGLIGHEIMGNPRGAFQSGIGAKLNKTFRIGKFNV